MKVIFHLKGGQKNELLMNLIFHIYPDSNGISNENTEKAQKKKKPQMRFLILT